MKAFLFLLGRRAPAHLLRGTGMANTYVLGTGSRLVVVDPGAASSAGAVLDFVTQELGRRASDISEIVVTHLHCDHIGGVAALAGESGARVAMSVRARPYVEGTKRMRWAPIHRWMEMMTLYRQTDFTLPSFGDIVRMPWAGSPLARRHGLPFRVTRWLEDREPLGDAAGWRVVASPGHTDDSICLHHGKAKALVSGDVVLGVAGKACFNPFYAFDEDQPRSERRLLKLAAERVLPGHGVPVLEGGIDADSGLAKKKSHRRKNT